MQVAPLAVASANVMRNFAAVFQNSEVNHDVNPAGIKGLGELANVGNAAAVANAVYRVTGKRMRQLPIRFDNPLTV
jgi:CO/xanthine dehydrogenase Mo-binding subunit